MFCVGSMHDNVALGDACVVVVLDVVSVGTIGRYVVWGTIGGPLAFKKKYESGSGRACFRAPAALLSISKSRTNPRHVGCKSKVSLLVAERHNQSVGCWTLLSLEAGRVVMAVPTRTASVLSPGIA